MDQIVPAQPRGGSRGTTVLEDGRRQPEVQGQTASASDNDLRCAANDPLRNAAAASFDRWSDALAAALRRGGVTRLRSERLAVLTISALEGAIVMARAHRELAPLDTVAREMDAVVAELIG